MRLVLACLLVLPLAALAAPEIAVPGGRLAAGDASAADSVAMPDAPYAPMSAMATAEGTVTRQVWQVADSGATPLQLLMPLRESLVEAGYDVVFDCADRACGGYDFRFGLDLIGLPSMVVDLGNFHYLLARRDGEQVALLASRDGATGYVHVTVVGPATAATAGASTVTQVQSEPESAVVAPSLEPPALPQGDLARTLETVGRVALDDLAFASGSTALAEGESADLAALAAWMSKRPESRIALVGHTDAVGSLAANIRLSRARAEAVAARLIDRYGIDPDRVEADGAGYLAPRQPNVTEAGRAANRRVEAVWLDTAE